MSLIHNPVSEKVVPEFAFPDLDLLEIRKNARPLTETYAFVQTDMFASRTVGYCRRFKYKDPVSNRREKYIMFASYSSSLQF